MTQKHQPRNLTEYISQLKTSKTEFYRKIRKRTGMSLVYADRLCKLDATTKNPLYLDALSKETGIAKENLFKQFDDEIN